MTTRGKIITAVMCLAAEAILFFVLGYSRRSASPPLVPVTVRQIAGERIVHGDMFVRDTSLTFRTVSKGKGEIETTIDTRIVPEARAYLDRVNAVHVSVIGLLDEHGITRIVEVMYLRRWRNVSAGAGVLVSSESIGGSLAVQYWF